MNDVSKQAIFHDSDEESLRENDGWMADRMSDKMAEVADKNALNT